MNGGTVRRRNDFWKTGLFTFTLTKPFLLLTTLTSFTPFLQITYRQHQQNMDPNLLQAVESMHSCTNKDELNEIFQKLKMERKSLEARAAQVEAENAKFQQEEEEYDPLLAAIAEEERRQTAALLENLRKQSGSRREKTKETRVTIKLVPQSDDLEEDGKDGEAAKFSTARKNAIGGPSSKVDEGWVNVPRTPTRRQNTDLDFFAKGKFFWPFCGCLVFWRLFSNPHRQQTITTMPKRRTLSVINLLLSRQISTACQL